MEKIKHCNAPPPPRQRFSPTFHATLQPFPRQLPELDAVGHSLVRQARRHQREQKPSPTLAIIFPRRGGQRFHIDGQWFSPVGGEMLLVKPRARITTGDAPISRIDCYDLYLRMDQPGPFLGDQRYEPIRQKLLALPTLQTKAPPGAALSLRDIYRRVETRRDDPMTVPWVTLKIGLLLLDVLDAVEHRAEGREPAYVAVAERFIRQHLFEPMNLEQLVSHTGYSRSALVDAFRRQRGVPPMEWRLRLKIEYACERLARTGVSIAELSARLGFVSPQYFATVFKRFMSVNPTRYRQRRRRHNRT